MGLTLALRLAQRGHRVTLLEAADHIGGLADAWQLGDITWDRHYHVTLFSDSHLRGILRELGLDSKCAGSRPVPAFWSTVAWSHCPTVGSSSAVSAAGTDRQTAAGMDHLAYLANAFWQQLEQIPASRLPGQVLRPANVRAYLAAAAESQVGRRLATHQRSFHLGNHPAHVRGRRMGLKREMFGYLPGGYAIVAAFSQRLEELGVTIHTGAASSGSSVTSNGMLTITCASRRAPTCDRVVVTTPAPVAARVCPQLTVGETRAARRRRISWHHLSSRCCWQAAGRLLRDEHHGRVPFYRRDRNDGPGRSGGTLAAARCSTCRSTRLPTIRAGRGATMNPRNFSGRVGPPLSGFLRRTMFLLSGCHACGTFRPAYARLQPPAAPVETSVPAVRRNSAQIVNGTLNVNETVRTGRIVLGHLLPPLPILPPILVRRIYAQANRELVARPR